MIIKNKYNLPPNTMLQILSPVTANLFTNLLEIKTLDSYHQNAKPWVRYVNDILADLATWKKSLIVIYNIWMRYTRELHATEMELASSGRVKKFKNEMDGLQKNPRKAITCWMVLSSNTILFLIKCLTQRTERPMDDDHIPKTTEKNYNSLRTEQFQYVSNN